MKFLTALNYIYQTTKAKPWSMQKPIAIQFPVNDVCNCRCQMCNIWQQKFDYQITPSQLEQALANPLFSQVKMVGVNGGEPTLRKDLSELVDVLFKKLPKLSSISLITNSLNSNQVIERISEIGKVIKSHDGYLDVMISLDGVGEVHDRVRGRKGNFDNAVKVIDFIQNSEWIDNYRLGCTVIKENVYGIEDLLEFALSKQIYLKYRLGIPHQRLYSQAVVAPFDLTFEEKYHFAVFLENIIRYYEKSEQQQFFYRSLIDQLMYQKPRAAGCDWQHRGVTLSARGELLYCAVESKTLGSAVSEDAEQLYFSNQQHLADIVNSKCDRCAHDYVGLPPTKILLKTYTKKALNKLGIPPEKVEKIKFVKPIKLLKQQLDFTKKMTSYGVNFDRLPNPQPATSFPQNSVGKRKVLICGWYGTETLGDKAILGGIINSLQVCLGEIELHLASLELYVSEMTLRQMPELLGCKLYSVTEAIKITPSMDLVVFGGGPLMAIPSLAETIAIFQKAVKAQVPTLIAGCGVGPLGFSRLNEGIKYLLLHASGRIYRDRKSRQIAHNLGINTTLDQVAEDPAFTWLDNCMDTQEFSPSRNNISEQPRLLLGLRDWTYQEYAPHLTTNEGEEIQIKFETEIIKALEELLHKYPQLIIVPFPMCTNHIGNDDRWFYRRLFRNQTQIYNALDLSYLGAEITPLEAVKAFQSASIALVMRFHSLVFAVSANVPVVAIDYTLGEGKVKSLAEKCQVPHQSLDSITADFIVSSLSQLLENKKQNLSDGVSRQALNFSKTISQFLRSLEK